MVMPDFIDWTGHGAAAGAPPVDFKGAHAYVFALDASTEAIEALSARLLAPAADGRVSYRAAAPLALVSFVDIERCTPRHNPIGWTTGRECAIWTLLWEHRDDHLPRLVAWSPYVFISYSIGLITGREVWGWPKEGATIAMSIDPPHEPNDLACGTMIFRDFGPDQQGREETLIQVRATTPGPGSHTPLTGIGHAFDSLRHWLSDELASLIDKADFAGWTLPAVTVKQFRDSENPRLACYRKIVNSPCTLGLFHGGGFLHGRFEVEFAQCRSHAILADVEGGQVQIEGTATRPVKWALWLNFDFTAERGSAVPG